jgi:hypothetical protein
MEVESRIDRSQRGYSKLEQIQHSNCLLVGCTILGFFAFAVCLAVGMATNWIMTRFWLYAFFLFGFGGLICWFVVGWQVYLIKREKDDAHKKAHAEIRLLNKTTTLVDDAIRYRDHVDLTRNDEKGVTDIKVVRSAVVLEQARIQAAARVQRITESKQHQLPQHAGQDTTPPQRPSTIDARVIAQRKLIASIHVPTFAESLRSGLIGPGQEKILICHELQVDEYTGELTGRLRPYQDDLSNNCTMFLGGGSKSGKSTLMANLGAQEAIMSALFYIIDPHLGHPEKSIAVKLAPLKHTFILPPAQSDEEIRYLLDHATNEADCRVHTIETPYSSRPIVVIIDEVLNLFGRAQRHPEDKELQKLYRDLAFFMRDLGTQYNKYDVNGIFATQYLTKEAFKLPGNQNVDFRDACQNQTLLRLPPNQAQVMRLLQRDELREMRALRQGFGFMGFATGDIIRMAASNITLEDIKYIASLVPAAPTTGNQFTGWSAPRASQTVESNGANLGTVGAGPISRASGYPTVPETPPGIPHKSHLDGAFTRTTGELENPVKPLIEQSGRIPDASPFGPGDMQFTDEQVTEFIKLFKGLRNRKECLRRMRNPRSASGYGLSNRYDKHAMLIIEQYKLEQK